MASAPIGKDAELIGRFYDAALDDRLWKGLSSKVAEGMEATSGVVKLHDSDDLVRLLDVTDNLVVAERLQEWAEHWHLRDLWVERAAAAGPGRIVTSQQLVTDEEQRRSGFYQEWLRELAIFHMVGTAFPAGGGRLGVFGVHRPRDAPPFSAEDGHRMALLVPHVARAFQMGERLAGADLAREAALESLDVLGTGVVIVSGSSRVLHVNAAAEEILQLSGALAIRMGKLVADAPALQARIATAVRDAADLAAGTVKAAPPAVRIERNDRSPCTMTILPLRPRHTALLGQRPLALVLLRDPEHPPILVDNLRNLFGFTRTEALVAAELARGQALPQIARALNIEVATVRTHLKQVLLKTDTRRQAEAVSAILRSTAPLPGE